MRRLNRHFRRRRVENEGKESERGGTRVHKQKAQAEVRTDWDWYGLRSPVSYGGHQTPLRRSAWQVRPAPGQTGAETRHASSSAGPSDEQLFRESFLWGIQALHGGLPAFSNPVSSSGDEGSTTTWLPRSKGVAAAMPFGDQDAMGTGSLERNHECTCSHEENRCRDLRSSGTQLLLTTLRGSEDLPKRPGGERRGRQVGAHLGTPPLDPRKDEQRRTLGRSSGSFMPVDSVSASSGSQPRPHHEIRSTCVPLQVPRVVEGTQVGGKEDWGRVEPTPDAPQRCLHRRIHGGPGSSHDSTPWTLDGLEIGATLRKRRPPSQGLQPAQRRTTHSLQHMPAKFGRHLVLPAQCARASCPELHGKKVIQVGGSARVIAGKLANAGVASQHIPAMCVRDVPRFLKYMRRVCKSRAATHIIVWGLAFANREPSQLYLELFRLASWANVGIALVLPWTIASCIAGLLLHVPLQFHECDGLLLVSSGIAWGPPMRPWEPSQFGFPPHKKCNYTRLARVFGIPRRLKRVLFNTIVDEWVHKVSEVARHRPALNHSGDGECTESLASQV
eukprot:6492392-Amphidinium_carterae.1